MYSNIGNTMEWKGSGAAKQLLTEVKEFETG
jgi:hypothetical protein